MNKKTNEVLEKFCADKMNVEEAARDLNMSVEDFLEKADKYEYTPTVDDVREADEIVQTAYNHIKSRSLKKLELIARRKILVPQTISIPTSQLFVGAKTDVTVDITMHPTKYIEVYRPLGLRSTYFEHLIERENQKKRRELGASREQSKISTSDFYCSVAGNQTTPSYYAGENFVGA